MSLATGDLLRVQILQSFEGMWMSDAEIKRLLSVLQANPELLAEFNRLRHDPAAVARLVAEKGYWLTRQDVEELSRSLGELSDDELDQAAGGAWNDPQPSGGG
jgi:predicted ribosomally synthesized peptide with nif11-like leader